MATILVSGGAGYVGSHACKALQAVGHEPVVFDNFSTGWRGAVQFGAHVEGDLLNPEDLAKAFEAHRPEAVMHFAAFSNVGESVQKPELYWRNNVTGSLNLFTAAREAGVETVVFSSTCATYGEALGDTLTEGDPQIPVNPYGRTKLAVEHLLGDFNAAFGMRAVIFRYFNAAGADPERRIGEDHRPETHLIPLVLDAASGRREKISIFGSDYPTPDGTCIRDYIHVDDLASAHVLGLDWLLDGGAPLALNLGTGSGYSVREVIDTARRVTQTDIPVEETGRRPGDPPQLVSGSALARETLGWEPVRSDLATMIGDAWGWHQMPRYES
ncbi:MAG: UDP-glucose 4-epimerase GalE [Paracoccaceae bacterium]